MAVCIIGPVDGWPITIAVSRTPRDIYRQARRWNYSDIRVHSLAWCIDREQAERLAQILETLLAIHKRPSADKWFDLDAAIVAAQLDHAAEKARVRIFDEVERRQRLELIVERNIARITHEIDGSQSPNVVALPPRRPPNV